MKKFQEKTSKNLRKIFTDFEHFLEKKQLKSALFLKFFQEILKAIKAMVKHVSFYTKPSVSLKNLKKVPKKVLT